MSVDAGDLRARLRSPHRSTCRAYLVTGLGAFASGAALALAFALYRSPSMVWLLDGFALC